MDLSEYRYHNHGLDKESLKRSLVNLLVYAIGKDQMTATHRDWFHTTANAVRERLIERWMETMRSYYRADAKRVYYLSLEFLTGRLLASSLVNMGFYQACRDALADLDLDINEIEDLENDQALGNGGSSSSIFSSAPRSRTSSSALSSFTRPSMTCRTMWRSSLTIPTPQSPSSN